MLCRTMNYFSHIYYYRSQLHTIICFIVVQFFSISCLQHHSWSYKNYGLICCSMYYCIGTNLFLYTGWHSIFLYTLYLISRWDNPLLERQLFLLDNSLWSWLNCLYCSSSVSCWDLLLLYSCGTHWIFSKPYFAYLAMQIKAIFGKVLLLHIHIQYTYREVWHKKILHA